MKTVIEMAREAGFDWHRHWNDDGTNRLERFAELVRADERERIKKANAPEIEKINAHIKLFEATVADEREACAKVCETEGIGAKYQGDVYAAAIRARGNK